MTESKRAWVAVFLSLLAILVSAASWFEARKARNLSYLVSLPHLTATAELIEPLQVGRPVLFRVVLENQGSSPARGLDVNVRYLFGPASQEFQPSYPVPDPFGKTNVHHPISDLGPGSHTTLVNTPETYFHLAHEHDLEAVNTGRHNLYVYGRAHYKDVYDKQHTLHFCRVYRPVPGGDPMKFAYCDSYNYTH